MNELQRIEDLAIKNKKDFEDLISRAENYLNGKKITINDERFNGQPYGHSRKSLKGKSFICSKGVFVYINDAGKLYIQPPDCNSNLLLDSCLIEEEGEK